MNPTKADLLRQIEELQARLAEAEETLRAIREGEVDAVIVSGSHGEQVFSLTGTESVYRLIVETMKEAAFTVTFDGTILFCNTQFGEFVKQPLEQVVGHTLQAFVTQDDRAAASTLLVAAQEQPIKQRLVFQASDGTAVPAHVSANVLNQPDGPSICVVASDLTELENSTELIQQLRRQQTAIQTANEELAAVEEELRVQNEELSTSRNELERAKARYQDLFETAPDGYLVTDPKGVIQEVNPTAARLFGRPAEQLKGKPFVALLPAAEMKGYLELLAALNNRTKPLPIWEVEILPPGGTRFWASVTAAASCDKQGQIVGLRWLVRDVTDRKRAEEALRETAAELVRSNNDLAQFAYAASHDLQAPLRQVTGFMKLLRDRYRGKLDAKADEYIDFAVNGATQMSDLITALLEYAKVGNQGVEFQPVSLREPLDKALAVLADALRESGAKVTVADLPTVRADGGQLAQVFQNLLENAMKFRSAKPLEIAIGAKRDAGRWMLWVSDNGIGLDPAQSQRVFELFTRLHDRAKYPGTGIGLAICKRIVERHGGRIWVDAKAGEGATFCLTLPGNGGD